jgi:hypothetical protein
MRPFGLLSRLGVSTAFVLLTAPALSGQSQPAQIAVPAAILNAKSVFVSNGGSDAGLFPEPFSGDPNRPYFSFVGGFQHQQRYELVADPSEADLVMEIHLVAPTGPQSNSKQLGGADFLPFFRLTIYDRKTHYVLWTIIEPIEVAILQRTHDKNFETALSHLVDDVQALSQPGAVSLYPNPPARQSPWMRGTGNSTPH